MRCAVKNCNNNNKSKPCTISFFNFPSDAKLLEQWKSFCYRDNKINVKTSQICMEHFKEEDFENSLQFKMGFTKRLLLKRGVVPTVRKVSSINEVLEKARGQRIQKRKNKKINEMLIQEYNAESLSSNELNEPQVQPMNTENFMERELHIKSEVISENETINVHDADSVLGNVEVTGLPMQPLKTKHLMNDQFHIKSELLSEDEIISSGEEEFISCNPYEPPVQSIQNEAIMEPELDIKCEVLSQDEITSAHETVSISCNVNAPAKQPMETENFREDTFHIKSEVLSEDTINVSHNVKAINPEAQPFKTEIFMEPELHIKSEILPEAQLHPDFAVISEHQKEKLVGNNSEKNKIECLKMEIERLSKEKSELRKTAKNQEDEIKAFKQREEKDFEMYEKDLAGLKSKLTRTNYELENLREKLLSIFSEGQIAKLKTGEKCTKWNERDVTHALTLYAAYPKFYKLLYRKQFSLPPVRILQSWARKINTYPGLLTPVFRLLCASTHMTEIDKICVLTFKEAKIRKAYCYDMNSDTTLAPVNYVQVAMIRGLNAKWQQPIFYKYDSKMTANILYNILSKLRSCHYTVAAIVSDLEDGNRALFQKMQVTEEKPWFTFDGEKVFVFADVPNMIKVLRNLFVEEGFLVNEKPVRAEIISKLLQITSTDPTIVHKICQKDLDACNDKRQKINLATNLFSNTVAQSIIRVAQQGHLEGLNWEECHRLFQLTNDWFDMMNVKSTYPDARGHCLAYGLSLETQNQTLDEMTKMVREMRAFGRKTLLPFQKGIIQTNNAIKGLYESMRSRYNLKVILTYRLNQNVLENFFEVIRAKNGLHDHSPDQLEFKYRLKSYILGQNPGITSNGQNIEKSQKCLTGKIIGVLNIDVNNEEKVEQELRDVQCDSLEKLAGYICHKLKDDPRDIAVPENKKMSTYSFADYLPGDELLKPARPTMQHMQELDNVFESNNEHGLNIKNDFIKSLIQQAHHIECAERVKALFFRTKLYLKIRELNREIFVNTSSS